MTLTITIFDENKNKIWRGKNNTTSNGLSNDIYIYNVQYAIKRKNEDYYINKIYGFGDFFGSRHGK